MKNIHFFLNYPRQRSKQVLCLNSIAHKHPSLMHIVAGDTTLQYICTLRFFAEVESGSPLFRFADCADRTATCAKPKIRSTTSKCNRSASDTITPSPRFLAGNAEQHNSCSRHGKQKKLVNFNLVLLCMPILFDELMIQVHHYSTAI